MLFGTTKDSPRWRLPASLWLIAMMMVAAAPPAALMLMQREAHRPVPYVTIEVSGYPSSHVTLRQAQGS